MIWFLSESKTEKMKDKYKKKEGALLLLSSHSFKSKVSMNLVV